LRPKSIASVSMTVELELRAVLAEARVRPRAAAEALHADRVLDDAVGRDELGDDDPAHAWSSVVVTS
jgi:hypothetical protein